MKVIDGRVTLRAPEGADWPAAAYADLSVVSDKGPSVAVYLTAGDCNKLARWLDEMWAGSPETRETEE